MKNVNEPELAMRVILRFINKLFIISKLRLDCLVKRLQSGGRRRMDIQPLRHQSIRQTET